MDAVETLQEASGTHNTNRCGLLFFGFDSDQLFAIGTLKVKELMPVPRFRPMPAVMPAILGAANIRGSTMPIVDMAHAVGFTPIPPDEYDQASLIITDCLRMDMGFIVRRIDRIADLEWREIHPPASGLGKKPFITGVSNYERQPVQIIDIELIIAEMYPPLCKDISQELADDQANALDSCRILIVDDSAVARRQLCEVLDQLQVRYDVANNGTDAYQLLENAVQSQDPVHILVSDIEMPGLNGYALTSRVKGHADLSGTYVILHTSLSSQISVAHAKSSGAEEALTKFDESELVQAMIRGAGAKTSP